MVPVAALPGFVAVRPAMTTYPRRCIRGIRSKDHFHEDGILGAAAFQFEHNPQRQDSFMEASVNWEDDPSVIDFTMNRKKGNTDEFEFKAGVAVVSLERLRAGLRQFVESGALAYERNSLPDNRYHGNLLVKDSMAKPTIRLVMAGMALAVVECRRR
jgi:hypothetical protein